MFLYGIRQTILMGQWDEKTHVLLILVRFETHDATHAIENTITLT